MINGAEDVDAVGFKPRLGGQQGIHARYRKGDVLNPFRRIGILAHGRRIWQFKKCQIAAGANLEKNVHIGIGLLGRRHLIKQLTGLTASLR